MPLFLLFVGVPIIEIALFIEVGGWLGLWPTLAIVILTAALGTAMLRRQGTMALQSLQSRLSAGENPGHLLADGALILVAGVLLLTPGFFTDFVGFALLIPPIRAWVIATGSRRIKVHSATMGDMDDTWQRPGEQTVDGTYSEFEGESPHRNTSNPNAPDRRD